MYRAFFGLREKPFNLTPDPKFLYLNASYREALAALRYGIADRKGFVSLIGEAGTGKTTLLRCLLAELGPEVRSVLVLNPAVGFEELLTFILTDLGRPPLPGTPKLQLLQALNTELLDTLRRGGNVVVLIDEAQDLAIPVLEELRLLSNLETANEKILQLVLAGQPELDAMLARGELRQLRQRIAVPVRLRPLARREVEAYIAARVAAAGGDPRGLFTGPALYRLWRFSRGVPRLVNVACDNALVTAYAEGSRQLTWKIVGEVVRDLRRTERRRVSRPSEPAPVRLRLRGVAAAAVVGALVGVGAGFLGASWPSDFRPAEVAARLREGVRTALSSRATAPEADVPRIANGDVARELAGVQPATGDDARGVSGPASAEVVGREQPRPRPDEAVMATPVRAHGERQISSPLAVAALPKADVQPRLAESGTPPAESEAHASDAAEPAPPGSAPDGGHASRRAGEVGVSRETVRTAREEGATSNRAAEAAPPRSETDSSSAEAQPAAVAPADSGAAPSVPSAVSAPADASQAAAAEPNAVARLAEAAASPEPVMPEMPKMPLPSPRADAAVALQEATPSQPPSEVPSGDAPPPATVAGPSALPPREIRVEKGDDLAHIARRYYGYDSRLLLEEIRRANPSIAKLSVLPVGQTIILPPDPFAREPSRPAGEARR